MLDRIFLDHLWIVLAVWALLYCSDYALTLVCARMYQNGANRHIEFETFELTPYYQKDVAGLRWISPRFLLMLCVSSALLALLWVIQASRWMVEQSGSLSVFAREGFRLAWGALVLSELAVHVRHVTNLALFAHLRSSLGATGKLSYRAWLTYRVSAAQLAGFSVIYLVCALTASSWFFVGGSAGCLGAAAQHWCLSARRRANEVVTEVEVVEQQREHDTDKTSND